MNQLPPQPVLTVWYNTRCPICDAGINFQKSRLVAAVRSGAITFRDINLEPDALARFGADIEAVRRRLHGVAADGALLVGIDCLAAIWQRTSGMAWLGWLAARPPLRAIAAFCYDRFADALYAWNRRKGHW